MSYDVLVLGGGPAGLAAAVSAKGRNLKTLLVSNSWEENPLTKAELVDNYLGIVKVSGRKLMEDLVAHGESWGVEKVEGRVVSALAFNGFHLTVGQDVYQGKSLILATGVTRATPYEGEEKLLGKGVSYCATCDGFLFRNRPVVVVGLASEAPVDAQFLQSIGCQVYYISPKKPTDLHPEIQYFPMKKMKILGEEQVTGVLLGEEEISCACVFLLRNSVAPTSLFPNIETKDGFIVVNRKMETNVEGLYAVGDCTGLPLQVAKAVGEGHIAGITASEWLASKNKE